MRIRVLDGTRQKSDMDKVFLATRYPLHQQYLLKTKEHTKTMRKQQTNKRQAAI